MSRADLDKRLARYQGKRIKYFNACITDETPEHLIVQNVTTQMELMAKVTMLKIVSGRVSLKLPELTQRCKIHQF